jgi:transcription-repair coupling factor (superfamily II helicase)
MKGETPEIPVEECTVDLQVQAHIPESYIDSTALRLDVYRRIADIKSYEDSSDVVDELIDRFGEPPAPVMNLIMISRIRYKATSLGIAKISEFPKGFLIYPQSVDPRIVAGLAAVYRRNFLFSAATPPYITLKCDDKRKDIEQFLGNLAEIIDNGENVCG